MLCSTCEEPLIPERLFCVHCGAVTPEGERVMGTSRTLSTTVDAPVGAGTFAPPPTEQRTPVAVTRRPGTTSAAAILSLMFGLLAYFAMPVVGAVIAIVTGHWARREIRASGGKLEGGTLAMTGLVLGYGQVLFVVGLVALIALIGVVAIAVR